MDLFSERFLPLIENSGKTDQELEKSMGLPRSIIYDWKHGRNKSSFKKYAANFAEYFNVSTDYLLGSTDDPTPRVKSSAVNIELIEMLSQLTPTEQEMISLQIKGIILAKKNPPPKGNG